MKSRKNGNSNFVPISPSIKTVLLYLYNLVELYFCEEANALAVVISFNNYSDKYALNRGQYITICLNHYYFHSIYALRAAEAWEKRNLIKLRTCLSS